MTIPLSEQIECVRREIGMPDLFGTTPRVLKGHGYAGHPGAGPAGETCGTCCHFQRGARGYHKCGHPFGRRTDGAATDILVRAPACERWERERNSTTAKGG